MSDVLEAGLKGDVGDAAPALAMVFQRRAAPLESSLNQQAMNREAQVFQNSVGVALADPGGSANAGAVGFTARFSCPNADADSAIHSRRCHRGRSRVSVDRGRRSDRWPSRDDLKTSTAIVGRRRGTRSMGLAYNDTAAPARNGGPLRSTIKLS